MQPIVIQARESAIKARRNLRDAQIDHDAGLLSAEELAEFQHVAQRAEANIRKAEAVAHDEQKERQVTARKIRFDAAMEKAKLVPVDAFDGITDMLGVQRTIVGRTAQTCVDQVAWLEGIAAGLHVKASQRAGEENTYDVRAMQGEGQNSPDSVVNRLEQVESEIAEYEALALACEMKYWSVTDECVKAGILPEAYAEKGPYFGDASNFGEALTRARRNNELRQGKLMIERQKEREAVKSAMPDIDTLMASRLA
jgi:hypothetical protein